MGYDAGIVTADRELIEKVAKYYERAGMDFDARWARDHGELYSVRGWVFREMTDIVCCSSTGHVDFEPGKGGYKNRNASGKISVRCRG